MSKKLSAIKKKNVSLKNRAINKIYKSNIKSLTKKYLLSLKSINHTHETEILSKLSFVYSAIDKAAKRGIIHKNHAARKKSVLIRAMKNKLSSS